MVNYSTPQLAARAIPSNIAKVFSFYLNAEVSALSYIILKIIFNLQGR